MGVLRHFTNPGLFIAPGTRAPERITPPEHPTIVKVQAPLSGPGDLLVYNEHRTFQFLIPTWQPYGQALVARMNGAAKKYFHGRLVEQHAEEYVLHIDDDAPDQPW